MKRPKRSKQSVTVTPDSTPATMEAELTPSIAPQELPPQVAEPDKVLAPTSPEQHEPEAATPTAAEEPPANAPTPAPSAETNGAVKLTGPGAELTESTAASESAPPTHDDLIRENETAAVKQGERLAYLLGALVHDMEQRGIGEKDLAALIEAGPGFDFIDLADLAGSLSDLAQAWKRRAWKI